MLLEFSRRFLYKIYVKISFYFSLFAGRRCICTAQLCNETSYHFTSSKTKTLLILWFIVIFFTWIVRWIWSEPAHKEKKNTCNFVLLLFIIKFQVIISGWSWDFDWYNYCKTIVSSCKKNIIIIFSAAGLLPITSLTVWEHFIKIK